MVLSCREFGNADGPTVLFVHDAGLAGWQWEAVCEALPDYHGLAVDLPGHGGSVGTPFRSPEQVATELVDVIRHLARRKVASVVGTGVGATLLLHLLTNHPGRVIKAVLGGLPDPARRAPWTLGLPGWLQQFPPIAKATARAMALPETAITRWRAEGAPRDPDSLRRAFTVGGSEPDGLVAVTVPTLILAGEWEGPENGRRAESLALAMRNGYSGVLKSADASRLPDNATLGAAVVRAWIEGGPLPEAIGDLREPPRIAVEQPTGPPEPAADDEGDWWEDV